MEDVVVGAFAAELLVPPMDPVDDVVGGGGFETPEKAASVAVPVGFILN